MTNNFSKLFSALKIDALSIYLYSNQVTTAHVFTLHELIKIS